MSHKPGFTFAATALGIYGGLSAAYSYGTSFEDTIIIDQKSNQVVNDVGGVRQVFTILDKSNNIYNVRNSFWYWQLHSTKLWSSLKEGKPYKIRGYGLKCKFWGVYPNIISVEEQ